MPKYVFNKDNLKEVEKLIKRRIDIYDKYFSKIALVHKNMITFDGKSIDVRDFLNMSYVLAYKNPLMSDLEFEEEVKKFHDAITPKMTKEELEFHRKTLIQYNKIAREENLKNLAKYKKEADDYEASQYDKNGNKIAGVINTAKLAHLREKSNPEGVEKIFNEVNDILNKEDFSEADFYEVALSNSLSKEYLSDVSKNNFVKMCKTGYQYMEMLDNFRTDMIQNIDSMDSNKMEDTYKMVVFGLLSQTYKVKSLEFKGIIERDAKTLDKFKYKEIIDKKGFDIIEDILEDCMGLGFKPNGVSSLTVVSAGADKKKSELDKEIATKARKITNTWTTGKVEFELLKSDYELVKEADKYLKNLNNRQIAKKFTDKVGNSFSGVFNALKNVTLSDANSRPRVAGELYQTIFIDGKPLEQIEPLKTYSKNVKAGNPLNGYKTAISEAILLKSLLEGGHHITCVRFTEFRNKLYTDIIPIHVNVNQKDYMASKSKWYRFWHGKRDIQAYLDKKTDSISKAKIEEFNKSTKSYLDSYSKEYYSNSVVVAGAKLDEEIGRSLGLDKKELDINLELGNKVDNSEIALDGLDKQLDNNLIK